MLPVSSNGCCHFGPHTFHKNRLTEGGLRHGLYGMREFITQNGHGNHMAVFFIYGNDGRLRLEVGGTWAKGHGIGCGNFYARKNTFNFYDVKWFQASAFIISLFL